MGDPTETLKFLHPRRMRPGDLAMWARAEVGIRASGESPSSLKGPEWEWLHAKNVLNEVIRRLLAWQEWDDEDRRTDREALRAACADALRETRETWRKEMRWSRDQYRPPAEHTAPAGARLVVQTIRQYVGSLDKPEGDTA